MRYWKQRGMELYDFCGGSDYKRKYSGDEVARYLLRKSKYRWTAMARRFAYRLFKWRQRRRNSAKRADHDDTARRAIGERTNIHLRIVEYADCWNGAVAAFNARLDAGGSSFRLVPPPDSHASTPAVPTEVVEKQYLVLDEGDNVRGGYVLKFQDFRLGGESATIADLRLPVSEAIVHRGYSHVAAAMLINAQNRQPMLYGLGMGGFTEPIARLLKAAGWQIFRVPFYFQILHPFAFFRNIVYLRKSAVCRAGCDFLAYSGLGWLCVAAAQVLHPRHISRSEAVGVEVVEDFGPWADNVWEAGKAHYGLCAVRDAATLRKMYPPQGLTCVRLKISDRGRPIGWSLLMNTALSEHTYFGAMRLGSIIDCFAEPRDAAQVIDQSRKYLVGEGVDLIVSNQSHRAWCEALRCCGFMAGPSNVLFASSRALTEAMEGKRSSATTTST